MLNKNNKMKFKITLSGQFLRFTGKLLNLPAFTRKESNPDLQMRSSRSQPQELKSKTNGKKQTATECIWRRRVPWFPDERSLLPEKKPAST